MCHLGESIDAHDQRYYVRTPALLVPSVHESEMGMQGGIMIICTFQRRSALGIVNGFFSDTRTGLAGNGFPQNFSFCLLHNVLYITATSILPIIT